ncbi:nostrin-like [Salvelinus alpinus]|uniref:nostrin-like n=1 Tax=Salvelinus alpinus TaxID=8036 RepID=UPI0039FD4E27
MAVFQQRAELEIGYAKGLQKLAGKLIKASKLMNDNSTYRAWCHVSIEMYYTADTHRALGSAFQAEAILEIQQVIEEHNKRKRPDCEHSIIQLARPVKIRSSIVY